MNPGLNTKEKGNKRVYLTREFPLRSNERYNNQVILAQRKKKRVAGIKGSTYLSNWIKLPDACILDYLHLSLEGTVKSLLNIWLSPSNSKTDFYLGKLLLLKAKIFKKFEQTYIGASSIP
jgi:hypothetical protein